MTGQPLQLANAQSKPKTNVYYRAQDAYAEPRQKANAINAALLELSYLH